jgi:hypothetical protein
MKLRYLPYLAFLLITFPQMLHAQLAWKIFGSLREARHDFCAAYLGNSQILVIGGYVNSTGGNQTGPPSASCELIDVMNRTIVPAAPMSIPRSEFVALLTKDSNVIVLGGETGNGTTASCELYERSTHRWLPAGNLLVPRRQLAAQFISDTEILVVGGRAIPASGIADAEIFDVATKTSRKVADYPFIITNHVAGISSRGSFVVLGGRAGGQNSPRSPDVYRYDQAADAWTKFDRLDSTGTDPTLIKLWDGRLVVSGGALRDADVLNDRVWIEEADKFRILTRLNSGRCFHQQAQWNSDSILVVGGWLPGETNTTVWMNLQTGQNIPGPPLNFARTLFRCIAVPTEFDIQGKPQHAALVAISGLSGDNATNTPTVEILELPCLAYARRSIDTAICAGESVKLSVPGSYSSFQWSTQAATRSITVTQPGTYWVSGTTANGCSMSDTMVVAIGNRLQTFVGEHGSPFEIHSTAVGKFQCDSVRLRNAGSATITVTQAWLTRNSAFNLVAGQLPLSIAPGEIRNLAVCYYPSTLEVERDTLMVASDCPLAIPIVAVGSIAVQVGSGSCASDLRFKLDTSAYYLKASSPYPNPSSASIQILIELVRPSGQLYSAERCVLVDAMGNEVANGVYAASTSEQWSNQTHELGSFTFDVRGVAQGLYFVRIISAEGEQVFSVVVER